MKNMNEFLTAGQAYQKAEEPIKKMFENLIKEADKNEQKDIPTKKVGSLWLNNLEQRKKEAEEFAKVFIDLEVISYEKALYYTRQKAEEVPLTEEGIGMLIGMYLDLSIGYIRSDMNEVRKLKSLCLNLFCLTTVINEKCEAYLRSLNK